MRDSCDHRDHLTLQQGCRIGVVGGGPAGSFFSYFLLEMARDIDVDVHLDIYEPRDFSQPGPTGCNMCGGIVSESLVQALAAEGIDLGPEVIQRAIDSYSLHMDVGDVHIATPRMEKRIASVHRGGGPHGMTQTKCGGLDGYLLRLATGQGANCIPKRVDAIAFRDGRPWLKAGDREAEYDLLVGAVGVNSSALKLFESAGLRYKAPVVSKTYICEFCFGRDLIRRELGYSMHVFLLNIPRLEFAALIPKGDYVTLCMMGRDLDKELVVQFINSREVRQCLPPNWEPPADFCHCAPKIAITRAAQPFADRLVFVGDCGTTRLYKDGIGSAYRTAKAAVRTVVFHGFSEDSFRRHYWPVCKKISQDNAVGQLVFAVTHQIQKYRFARRAMWRMVSDEQRVSGLPPRMSTVLWDTFTGSAPYTSVLRRILNPVLIGRFLWELTVGDLAVTAPKGGLMQSAVLGRWFKDGEIICRQGELGDSLYVVEKGQVELMHREGSREFCVRVLGEGDAWGEDGLLERDHTRSATARAVGEACVLTIEKGMFLDRMQEDPSFVLKIMRKMSRRIKELEDALVRTAEPMPAASTVQTPPAASGRG
jgi:flavin-dependent dehydrogenase